MENEKLVPKLRFSGFNEEWKSFKLNEISERITRKNKSLETDRPLTISAQYGLVDQIEYFNKIVASDSLINYYLLNKGEFAYNKSYSNGYPYGAVKRLDNYENGAISTLYICFKINEKMNSDLLKEYFETDKWYKEIYKIAVEGARNHGLLNIAVNDFFNTKHILPTNTKEQEKLSKFLITVNKKIDLLENQYQSYLDFKKYLMQQIFTQKLRFDFDDEWLSVKLKDISKVTGGKRMPKGSSLINEPNNHPYITVSNMNNDFEDLSTYQYVPAEIYPQIKNYIVDYNDLIISVAGTLGLVKKVPKCLDKANLTENANRISEIKINIDYLQYYLNTTMIQNRIIAVQTNNAQPKLALKEIRNFKIQYPSKEEQVKIVNLMSSVDNKISSIDNNLKNMQEFKKGLLQQMFV
ncbi:restriction endonuclease subunit S [Methanobrevibacter millerae]|uniref:Type I restriction enzyme, S subunit n=1 Tax=Methanobrevibacter millerae TaxID=230361 RepID=A0A1G5VGV6_9EURY|nr:restriction endonuclease subunit S [Methanobrevibacter millerae]SDA45004.1 type I restriction enzyme, S subunit [Methanobrevibacter millerae]